MESTTRQAHFRQPSGRVSHPRLCWASTPLAGALICPPAAFLESTRPVTAPLKKPRCRAAPPPLERQQQQSRRCRSAALSPRLAAARVLAAALIASLVCPLRRRTPFNFFSDAVRPSIKEQHPQADQKGISKVRRAPRGGFACAKEVCAAAPHDCKAHPASCSFIGADSCADVCAAALSLPSTTRAQLVGEQWAQLPAEGREPYNEQARQVRHSRQVTC